MTWPQVQWGTGWPAQAQLIVESRDETLEGGNGGWRGYCRGRDDQATASCVKQSASDAHQRDNAGARGWGRGGGMINGGGERRRAAGGQSGDQRRPEGFDGRERLQVDGRKRRRGKRLEMLMHVASSASQSECGDSDTERQHVHTHWQRDKLAHAIVFIVLICWFSNSGAAYIFSFLLLERPGLPKPGRPKRL